MAFVMLIIFIKSDVSERFVGDEFFLFGVFAGEVKVGVPGA